MWTEKLVFIFFYITIVWTVYRAVLDSNPVFSVLYLIFSFLSICALLMFLGADYLAILFVLIYGGAISILIMFVVMMLDLKELEIQARPELKFLKWLAVAFSIFGFLSMLSVKKTYKEIMGISGYKNFFEIYSYKSNVEVIGLVLYNHYIFQFIIIGFLLFISMIIVISLVIRKSPRAKSQVLFEQLKDSNLRMVLTK